MHPRRAKSFNGCWTCRSKKRRCDGKRPACEACVIRGEDCEGYQVKLVWVDRGGKSYNAQKERRLIPPEETWHGCRIYGDRHVNSLLAQCEHWATYASSTADGYTGSVPFTVFHANPSYYPPRPRPALLISGIPRSISRSLFYHFVTVTAPVLAPSLLAINPWSTIFPTAALNGAPDNAAPEKAALYHAMLAHAATHIVELSSGKSYHMKRIAIQNQTVAIEKLQESMNRKDRVYEYFVTTILLLMLVDVYGSGPRSRSWKIHFYGAWNYIKQQETQQPWTDSALGMFSTHMILILVIAMETTALRQKTLKRPPSSVLDAQIPTKSTISKATLTRKEARSTEILRFATNLSPLSCLADINLYEDRAAQGLSSLDELDEMCDSISQRLDTALYSLCLPAPGIDDPVFKRHFNTNAFPFIGVSKVATYIHLGRQIRGLTPRAVAHWVRSIFQFYSKNENMDIRKAPLWPMFIASVEAYEPESMSAAREWLLAATSVGMGNRHYVKSIVEEVWRRREAEARRTEKDIGEVKINWRIVMAEMDIDILLF